MLHEYKTFDRLDFSREGVEVIASLKRENLFEVLVRRCDGDSNHELRRGASRYQLDAVLRSAFKITILVLRLRLARWSKAASLVRVLFNGAIRPIDF